MRPFETPSSGVDVARRVCRHLRSVDQVYFLEIDGDRSAFLINRGMKDVHVVPSKPLVHAQPPCWFLCSSPPFPVIHSRMYAGQFLSWMLSASQRLRKLTAS